VHVVFLLDGGAGVVEGIEELVGEAFGHRLAGSGSGGANDPAHGERLAARFADFDGHLVGGTTDAARLDFDGGLHILDCLGKGIEGRLTRLLLKKLERIVHDGGADRFFTLPHHAANKTGNSGRVVLDIGRMSPVNRFLFSAHVSPHSSLGLFGAILRTALFAVFDAKRILRATNDVIAYTRKVFYTATADEHRRVLLKIVPDARNVCSHFDAIGEAHTGDFAESRVWFLRRYGHDARADAAALRTPHERGRLRLPLILLSSVSDKLVNSRHISSRLPLCLHMSASCASFIYKK
jgi:hypothetical protein